MQRFSRLSLVLATALTVACAAHAQMAERKPLVVIRFNQAHVYYDQQLYTAIAQAAAAKPDVMFDVVAEAPDGDSQWITVASHNTQAVVNKMQKFGVPLARMSVTGQTSADIKYDETRIYVR